MLKEVDVKFELAESVEDEIEEILIPDSFSEEVKEGIKMNIKYKKYLQINENKDTLTNSGERMLEAMLIAEEYIKLAKSYEDIEMKIQDDAIKSCSKSIHIFTNRIEGGSYLGRLVMEKLIQLSDMYFIHNGLELEIEEGKRYLFEISLVFNRPTKLMEDIYNEYYGRREYRDFKEVESRLK